MKLTEAELDELEKLAKENSSFILNGVKMWQVLDLISCVREMRAALESRAMCEEIENLKARYWSKVKVGSKNKCWEWQSFVLPNGYGTLSIKNIPHLAHRLALEFVRGPISKGLWVDHTCMNRKCVNPGHLRLVTPKTSATENTNGTAARNKAKTHCAKGHQYSGKNLHVRADGSRRCVTCIKSQKKEYRARKKRAREALAKCFGEGEK